MTTKQRILKFAAKVLEHSENLSNHPKGFDYDAWSRDDDKLEDEMMAFDKEAGSGLCVGRVLRFSVADGYATYIVTKIRKNDVVVEPIPLCDGYRSPAVGLSADKRNYIVLRSSAEESIHWADTFK